MGIAAPDQAELVLLHPGPARRVLLRSAAVIGSGAGCAIRLRDPRVAAEHGEVRWDGLRWILRPLVPDAELAVNDRPVTWTQLADRDVLRVADYLFGFRSRGPAAALPQVPAAADDVVAAACALEEERQAWELRLRAARAELQDREAGHRERISRAAAAVLRERDRVAAAERATVGRAAELDRLAGRLAEARREMELARGDVRFDARQLDERFADLGQERRDRFLELARLEALIDGARARLAAVRIETTRANRFGSLATPPEPRELVFRRVELPAPHDEPAPLRLSTAGPQTHAERPAGTERHARAALEPAQQSWREERRAALAELDERRRDLAARRSAFAAERTDFDRAAAGERARLRAERDALDRRRQWLDRAAERWAALRAAGGAEDVRREWARLRSDLLVERVELLCERDRLAAVEDEMPQLQRVVAKQRRLLARAHEEARQARGAWDAERHDRMREAEDLQNAVENLVAGLMLPDAPAEVPASVPFRRAA